MSRSELGSEDYVDFLIASPRQVTATEAARCQPESDSAPAHDAFTRLLQRLEPDATVLYEEARGQIQLSRGCLILDDSVLDKPYARKMDLVAHLWSGKHHRVVKGIGLITLLWTDGDRHIPCDYRLYDKSDGLTKNDHFRAMLNMAKERGFQPECVLFDSWYSGLENLKEIRKLGWRWLTRLDSKRRVNLNRAGLKSISELPISATGTEVWLEGYGLIQVFLIVAQDGDKQYWATSDLQMTELERVGLAEQSWKIEEFHRGIKQTTSIERCQMRSARAQRNHIELALRAFLRIEAWCFRTGVNWLMAKWNITRDAVRQYLKNPLYSLTTA
jgi:hypothetical protein